MKDEFFDMSNQEDIIKKCAKIVTVHIPHKYLEKVCKEEGKFTELIETIIDIFNKEQEEE